MVFVADRLVEDHVVSERRSPGPARIIWTLLYPRKDIDIVLRGHRPADEEGRHEGAIALRRLRHLGLDQRLDRLRRDCPPIVLKAHPVLYRQHYPRLRIVPREIDSEHGAEGIADARR